jgi:thioredoxin reductase (NADPH)
MSVPGESREQMFPKLTPPQVRRLTSCGRRRQVRGGDILYDQGDRNTRFFVVLSGLIECVTLRAGVEEPVTLLHPNEFTGEVDMISGSPSLVRARMRLDGEVLEIDRDQLRTLVEADPELGDVLMRAFLLRRVHLIAGGYSDAILVGSRHSSGTLRLIEFLTRNGYPYTYLDVDQDPKAQGLLDRSRSVLKTCRSWCAGARLC